MNIFSFIKNNNWYCLGKWKQPVFLACMTTHGMTSLEHGNALPFAPNVYANFHFRQWVIKKDYQKNITGACALFEKNFIGTFQKLKREVEMGIAGLNAFYPVELNTDTVQCYIYLVTQRARQWYEIMIADGAISELYPRTLPPSFALAGRKYTPASLLTKTALPKKLFPMIEEQIHLLEIAVNFKTSNNIEKQLEEHVRKFSWMNSLCWWDEPFTKEHYLNEIKKIASKNPETKLRKIKGDREKRYVLAEHILEELKKQYPEAYQYIDVIRELTDLKEENWDCVALAGVRLRPLFKTLAKKHNLSYTQLMHLSPSEFIELTKTKTLPVSVNILNARVKQFLIISLQNQQQEIFTKDKLHKFIPLFEREPPIQKYLKGTPIWNGLVTGTARILTLPEEVSRMRKGEILVCPMSDPDYMPAIRKAAAIIADQGGLLCHAAIVARELQIPCVVGTEYATKILKDGDKIEVDAEKGIVRKIKK